MKTVLEFEGERLELFPPCKACNGSGWTHEACIGRFATGHNERPDGKCGSYCGADECAVRCDCTN